MSNSTNTTNTTTNTTIPTSGEELILASLFDLFSTPFFGLTLYQLLIPLFQDSQSTALLVQLTLKYVNLIFFTWLPRYLVDFLKYSLYPMPVPDGILSKLVDRIEAYSDLSWYSAMDSSQNATEWIVTEIEYQLGVLQGTALWYYPGVSFVVGLIVQGGLIIVQSLPSFVFTIDVMSDIFVIVQSFYRGVGIDEAPSRTLLVLNSIGWAIKAMYIQSQSGKSRWEGLAELVKSFADMIFPSLIVNEVYL